MRTLKITAMLAGTLFTSITLADVPIIDAYQDSPSQLTKAAPTSGSTSIVSASAASASMPVDQRITVLERQVANLSQLLTQYNELQQQLQDLRGKLEIQKHDLQVLQEQVRTQYQDIDQRLGQANKSISSKNSPVPPSKPPLIKSDDSTSDEAPTPTVTRANTDVDSGESAYQAAFDLLKKKKYSQTITAFQSFIKKYPASKQVGNARYWLGMVYLTQGQPEQAVPQFQNIIKKNPQDAKVPDATLQLGMAYYANGDSKRAIAILKSVEEKYPESSAAKYAKGRLQQIQQSMQPNSTT